MAAGARPWFGRVNDLTRALSRRQRFFSHRLLNRQSRCRCTRARPERFRAIGALTAIRGVLTCFFPTNFIAPSGSFWRKQVFFVFESIKAVSYRWRSDALAARHDPAVDRKVGEQYRCRLMGTVAQTMAVADSDCCSPSARAVPNCRAITSPFDSLARPNRVQFKERPSIARPLPRRFVATGACGLQHRTLPHREPDWITTRTIFG